MRNMRACSPITCRNTSPARRRISSSRACRGAGGLLATLNYLFNQAPADGTTIGIVHSSVPLTPLFGNKGVRFDTLKFNWLGSLDRVDGMCISCATSPI